MAGAITKRSEDAKVPVLAMANRFSKYKPEEEKTIRKVDVVEDETLKRIKEAWNAFKYDRKCEVANYANYKRAIEVTKALKCSASDIGQLSFALVEFEGQYNFSRKAGIFLSALINSGKDSDYFVRTAHLAVPVEFLGERNTKNITVEGGVGRWCGHGMQGGSIMVKGDAEDFCGEYMTGGSITVEGGTGERCGYEMEGGSITVNGNVDRFCGQEMKGGTINARGDAGKGCGYLMKGGSITVNGNTGESCGRCMEGGSITVNGNVGDACGVRFKGGAITIEGDAGSWCGWDMKGGEIHVDGEIGGGIAEEIEHGKIFHKGKLIVDR